MTDERFTNGAELMYGMVPKQKPWLRSKTKYEHDCLFVLLFRQNHVAAPKTTWTRPNVDLLESSYLVSSHRDFAYSLHSRWSQFSPVHMPDKVETDATVLEARPNLKSFRFSNSTGHRWAWTWFYNPDWAVDCRTRVLQTTEVSVSTCFHWGKRHGFRCGPISDLFT